MGQGGLGGGGGEVGGGLPPGAGQEALAELLASKAVQSHVPYWCAWPGAALCWAVLGGEAWAGRAPRCGASCAVPRLALTTLIRHPSALLSPASPSPSPPTTMRLRWKAENPFQFLATCVEIQRAYASGE